jgi:hypothetical protein
MLLWQVDVPFKSSDEFEVNVDMKYKPKPDENKPNTYSVTGNRLDKTSSALSPFLNVNLTKLKILADEVKMKAMDSSGKTIFKRKTSADDIHLAMGFVDDLKAGEVANEVTIYFFSAEKKEIRKITCTVLSDGTFQVNGKWHGKF